MPNTATLPQKIWNVPVESIPAKPGCNPVEMFRAFARGDIRTRWDSVHQSMVLCRTSTAIKKLEEKEGRFIVVSDTSTTEIANVQLLGTLLRSSGRAAGGTRSVAGAEMGLLCPPSLP
jgi:hypothetical protein